MIVRVVLVSQPTTAAVKNVFCVAWLHSEGFPIATESILIGWRGE